MEYGWEGRACTPDQLLPPQVAQYIKFEMPVLKSFIQKLQEEEDREVRKLVRKYVWPQGAGWASPGAQGAGSPFRASWGLCWAAVWAWVLWTFFRELPVTNVDLRWGRKA